MIKLQSNKQRIATVNANSPRLYRVTTQSHLPVPARSSYALKTPTTSDSSGWGLVLLTSDQPLSHNIVRLDNELDYLSDGDVIRFNPLDQTIRALYRHSANANAFLLTERCNSYCLMCSQPPRNVDDHYLVTEILEALPLIPQDAREIILSGGEPTLWGDEFVEILRAAKTHLPTTAVHVLTNGRTLKDDNLGRKIAEVNHPDLMFGIPLYSDIPEQHEFIVQAKGAFDETIKGILNLKARGQLVELRIVITKVNVDRLPELADFICRNLLFVDHVALMGMEITGFTRANLEALWIDPFDYRNILSNAISIFRRNGVHVSVYNHPLCLINDDVWPLARKSISDWKNEYMPECEGCSLKNTSCGGFFASAKHRYSSHVQARL